MSNRYLEETEETLIRTALRSAAEKWDAWSLTVALPRIADEFKGQAARARKLADELDEAAGIKVLGQ
jgi:hypothetical protein